MKKNLLFLALAGLAALAACNDPDAVGVQVQPGADKLNVLAVDTFAINTITQTDDSVISKNATYGLLGSYKDPVFGQSEAGIFSQLSLFSAQNVLTNSVVDSIFFTIPYGSIVPYGDTTVAQTIDIYKITGTISDSAYYSNRSFQYDNSTILGSATFLPHYKDSVVAGSKKLTPQIRVQLSNAFGNELLMNAGGDDAAFKLVEKGIYIKTRQNTAGGNVVYVNLLSTDCRMTIYYKQTDGTTVTSKVFSDIGINGNAIRVNHFDHSYAGTNIKLNVKDSLAYLQAMAGTRVKIEIPGLKNFAKNNNILINQAEFIVPVAASTGELTYPAPDRAILVGSNSAGHYSVIADNLEAISYYGGYYNATQKNYHFNISKYMQSEFSSFKNNSSYVDYGLYLSLSAFIANSVNTANRVVVQGGGKVQKMKLKLTYTKLN